MTPLHTRGPWRWEYNERSKCVRLVGGLPKFDLTVMDFARWGMTGATPRFRELSQPGLNLMRKVCRSPGWIAPIAGREHHAVWCAAITHPDAVLIESAPELAFQLLAAANYIDALGGDSRSYRAATQKATGSAA